MSERIDAAPRERLVLLLAESLHEAGVSAHRLEQIISDCGRRLGVPTTIFAVPTGITVAFGEPGAQRTSVLRVRPGVIDLERVHLLYALVGDLLDNGLSVTRAMSRIRAIGARPPRYGAALTLAGFAATSAGAARIFGGGLAEIVAAAVVGLLVGLVVALGARSSRYSPLTDFAAGAAASMGAWLAVAAAGPLQPGVVVLAAVIILLPGLTLTVAINELATQNLTAGTTRLTGAMMTLVALGFGVAIGNALMGPLVSTGTQATPPLPAWTLPVALLLLAGSLVVLFRARPHDGWLVAVAVGAGYLGALLGTNLLGPELGVSVGALLVGILGNAANRFLHRPAGLVVLPGLMALVPGSVGFRGVTSFLADDVTGAIDSIFAALLIAGALVAGLLIADVAVATRRPL
ncbi:MAG: threonine/serine exporter family protein [Planctomycetota bacterium]